MGIAATNDHIELGRVARSFLIEREARGAARKALDDGPYVPDFWLEIAEMGWLGLHISADLGGSGFSLLEAAIVADEMGRQCCPGPLLAVAAVAAAIAGVGSDAQRERWLPALLDGSLIAGLGLAGDIRRSQTQISGSAGAVLAATGSGLLALKSGEDLILVDTTADGVQCRTRLNMDPSQPCDDVTLTAVEISEDRIIPGGAAVGARTLSVLATAQAAGGAAACLEMATAYAVERHAFGRPIGQFQAIKHHAANMLLEAEAASALAWNAATTPTETMAVRAAVSGAVRSFLRCAELNIQIHGGIGFTWEHDAHLYLRRASAIQALLSPLGDAARDVALVAPMTQLGSELPLPPESAAVREKIRPDATACGALDGQARHDFLIDHGYLYPSWPKPYGRAANAVEQLVIDQEFSGIDRLAGLGPNQWILPIVLPLIIECGTEEQKQRWVGPSLKGELTWCALLSEPGAGSDLAAVATRAVRGDGGWIVTGQKVWTSDAQIATFGAGLVRTDPSLPKHKGLTYVVVDMKAPGVTVRPLRQVTGGAHFNEVFLDEVFVPDENVLGAVNDGWRVNRAGLGYERVSLGQGTYWSSGPDWLAVQEAAPRLSAHEPHLMTELGELLVGALAIRALNLRSTVKAIEGIHGVEGSLTKVLVAEQAQRIARFGLKLAGAEGVYLDGDVANLTVAELQSRHTTIAGGSSEILRNVLAEAVLGLPRDVGV